MSLSIGIVGLPNVGKSTLFNALLKRQQALAANYPFATIEPNVGVVDVPDERLKELAQIYNTQKIVPAVIKFYDIAGLVQGAHEGEGLGNAFLSHIRETDAILHVVRAFTDDNVVNAGSRGIVEDIGVINTELVLADLNTLTGRIEKFERDFKRNPSRENIEKNRLYQILLEGLNKNILAKDLGFNNEEINYLKDLNLLTLKPKIYIINVNEADLNNQDIQNLVKPFGDAILISAKVESELGSLGEEMRNEFMKDLGISENSLDTVIKKSYSILNLQTFLTAGPKEVRAWTIAKGTKAPQAAGKIHTDMERGFIKATIINYLDFIKVKSMQKAKELGLIRLEGKDYVMKEGDIAEFHFNV